MEFIHSFLVSQDVREPMEISSTNTRDVIIAGQQELAIFNGDGVCTRQRSLENDPNGRGVAIDSQGHIIITSNIRSTLKCRKCEGSVCRLKVARLLRYDTQDSGTDLYLTTACSSGRHVVSNVYLSQSELDNVAICAVEPSHDFHTVLCDVGNKCLYIFKHDQIIKMIGGPKYFVFPHVIASLSTGDIVVGDYLAKRIKIFSREGKFLNEFGESIQGGIFPHGVTVDSKDRIIVADKDNHRVLMFDNIGFHLQTLIRDTIEDDMDIRPIAVSVKKSVNGDRLYVLLKGLPGMNFAQVRVYALTAAPGRQEKVPATGSMAGPKEGSSGGGRGASAAPYREAPPSYSEVTNSPSATWNYEGKK